MKHLVLITLLMITSCKYLDGGLIFLDSKDCISAIKEKRDTCSLVYEDMKVTLQFQPTPSSKGEAYNIRILSDNIKSANAELIGLSMKMPLSVFDFTRDSSTKDTLQTRVSPGLCLETKMLWRLKLMFTSSTQQVYYTFIDYQIGR